MTTSPSKIICGKCGRERKNTDFFKLKTGEHYPICKDCLTQYIDNRDPETFKWILQKFDVPFIEEKWNAMASAVYKKNPSNFGPKSVIGRYLRAMNMVQFSNYSYADTDMLNADVDEQKANFQEKEDNLRQQYEEGKISKAEYYTMSQTKPSSLTMDGLPAFPATVSPLLDVEDPQEYLVSLVKSAEEQQIINEPDETEKEEPPIDYMDLTEDEIQYLTLKWGSLYSPQQWIAMETMYRKYAADYEITVDREEVLKTMCKTSIKMNEALDTGDITAFKNLAAVFDQLRKSAKFTEAQKKDETVKYLDSIGELVAFCEQEGGIIDQYPLDPVKYPQDKVDFTLRDLKSYTYNLVTNELGLGDLIESYISKLEKAEKDSENSLDQGLITSAEEASAEEITDEEAESFQNFLEDQVEQDADSLFKMLGLER